jgi:hypothetical protein
MPHTGSAAGQRPQPIENPTNHKWPPRLRFDKAPRWPILPPPLGPKLDRSRAVCRKILQIPACNKRTICVLTKNSFADGEAILNLDYCRLIGRCSAPVENMCRRANLCRHQGDRRRHWCDGGREQHPRRGNDRLSASLGTVPKRRYASSARCDPLSRLKGATHAFVRPFMLTPEVYITDMPVVLARHLLHLALEGPFVVDFVDRPGVVQPAGSPALPGQERIAADPLGSPKNTGLASSSHRGRADTVFQVEVPLFLARRNPLQ